MESILFPRSLIVFAVALLSVPVLSIQGEARQAPVVASADPTATAPLAARRKDTSDPPSSLEGIPVGGFVMTLVIAAFIGAAAGKIYVSLSDDE